MLGTWSLSLRKFPAQFPVISQRTDFYLFTVFAGHSLSPVLSRSWSFPLFSPSVQCTPVAVGFFSLCVCSSFSSSVRRVYPNVAFRDPVVIVECQ